MSAPTLTRFTEDQLSDPIFDQPSTPNRAKIFVCSTPRTGSWLLCRAMMYHGIGIPHEYYNPRHFAVLGPRYGVQALLDHQRLETDPAVRRAYNTALVNRRSPNGIFSVKIHWGEYLAYLDNPEGNELFQNGHFIHLYREDLLSQAISFHIARETGIWGSDGTVGTPPAAIPRFLDADLIDERMRELVVSDMNWRLFFARNGITPLSFSFERLRDELPAAVSLIMDRCGLDVPKDLPAYEEQPPSEIRDVGVPQRSAIRAAFIRAHRRVTPAGHQEASGIGQNRPVGHTGTQSGRVNDVERTADLVPGTASVTVIRNGKQKICLCMIAMNEARVIARCLASVRPLIDHWVIVDTGSTDGTQDVVRSALSEVPGELFQRPLVDFAHNRNEALALAKPHGDYILIIDADDIVTLPPGFRLPMLKDDSITIDVQNKGVVFTRPQLLKSALPWRYEGVLHEFLSCGVDRQGQRILAQNRSQKRLPGARIVMKHDGTRRSLPVTERSRRDAATLEAALITETDPYLVARYTFYLSQAYFEGGDNHKALETYLARASLGGWDDEVFVSLYRAASLKADLGFDAEDVITTFLQAHGIRPNRAEALYGASRFCRIRQRYQEGYDYAKRGLRIKRPADVLFSEVWVYDYGLLDEYAINAFWIGQYQECLDACRTLLANEATPAAECERIRSNADAAREKLAVPRISVETWL